MTSFEVVFTDRFNADFKALPREIQNQARACVQDVLSGVAEPPHRKRRRVHSVSGKGHKPIILTADVTADKAYKLSFEFAAGVVTFRRVDTHKGIDRSP